MTALRRTSGSVPHVIPLAAPGAAEVKKRGRRGGRRRNRKGQTLARIHEAAAQRQDAWRRGDRQEVVEQTTEALVEMYGHLAVERSRGEVARPALEGVPCLPGNRTGAR